MLWVRKIKTQLPDLMGQTYINAKLLHSHIVIKFPKSLIGNNMQIFQHVKEANKESTPCFRKFVFENNNNNNKIINNNNMSYPSRSGNHAKSDHALTIIQHTPLNAYTIRTRALI